MWKSKQISEKNIAENGLNHIELMRRTEYSRHIEEEKKYINTAHTSRKEKYAKHIKRILYRLPFNILIDEFDEENFGNGTNQTNRMEMEMK